MDTGTASGRTNNAQDGADLVELLRGCSRGDRAALKALYDAEASRMTGVAMRILFNRDQAEDAVQDAFIQIWRKASRYDVALGSPRAWMYTIVRYRAIDILRARGREQVTEPEDLDKLREDAVDLSFRRLDKNGILYHCLKALEDDRRYAVLLIYVTGLTQEEVAGKLGRPLGTIKSWLRRGLQSLKACLS
ncbi:sigma-70 family RNA polymerase sigma factor [Heliomarina baculiformis]|uniref:sigma-70 family RNA polymerase sigma factor n=1 Tax=Heliomarina baculiformis TaxID=2872036 RepID=UPI001EE19970